MIYQEPTVFEHIKYAIFSDRKRETMELVTNGDEGMKCEDFTDETPWREFRLWGYDYDGTDSRCHFCKKLVGNPKPYDAICGEESCEAFWALNMIGINRIGAR